MTIDQLYQKYLDIEFNYSRTTLLRMVINEAYAEGVKSVQGTLDLPGCPLCGARPEIVTLETGAFVQCSDSLSHEHSEHNRYMSEVCNTRAEAVADWIKKCSGEKP